MPHGTRPWCINAVLRHLPSHAATWQFVSFAAMHVYASQPITIVFFDAGYYNTVLGLGPQKTAQHHLHVHISQENW